MNKQNKIKILMASAEAAPFAKVGGLADVAGSLPPALKKLGCDIRLVMPLYGSIDKKKYGLKKIYADLEVPSGQMLLKVDIWESKLPGTSVPVYFIDCPEYFKYDEVYLPGNNSERFLFFSLTALYVTPILKFIPDIVHCQDSHVALIPDIIKSTNLPYLKNIKTLFTIHNYEYQGIADVSVLSTGNLTIKSTKSLTKDAQDGDINFMAQGVLNADLVNTVSPTYAKEITTSAYGAGLEKVIRQRKASLSGIVNGIDVDFFDPAKDKYIEKNYSVNSIGGKGVNKAALQKRLGLPQEKGTPVVALVSRLVWQKGLELITDKFAKLPCQFVFLGTGSKVYEKQLEKFAVKFPNKVSANIKFDIGLAQLIYAGSDIFIMPSRFEPCGLGQMIAMRYGTIPVVRATGGLADTVTEKLGFSFFKFSSQAFYNALLDVLQTYHEEPEKWLKMKENCMKADFSWDKSAEEYIKLYKKLLKK
jgi:starch synthase